MTYREELIKNANLMVAKGKGILAADESTPTCTKRFNSIGVDSTERKRNEYRDMLLTTPNMEDYISGVIFYDETLRQSTLENNTPFTTHLLNKGVISGIKVDMGAKVLSGHEDEKITEGLDNLRERLDEYYKMGARFAKWRAVITIGDGIPTKACYEANAHALARYASLCQESGIVPIVEPEVLMDGSHTIDECFDVTVTALIEVFKQLDTQSVMLEGIVLKPNMILSGNRCPVQAGVEEVAHRTIECLKSTVPLTVPGIAFLSGGQSNEDATAHLNMMNAKYGIDLQWNLTYSYGRALQQSALNTWLGKIENVPAAQEAFFHRAKLNGLASKGEYSESME
jgi:fructose-bisphosphate aldolase class I|tara:strand:+ start:40 stop:1062 length:1023 start_codon:yes stop_codon:yes gene_type:complete